MDRAVGDEVLVLGAVGLHVLRGAMGLEIVHGLPLFDDHESVRAELGERAAIGVDRGAVLDAALLGMHGRHVGLEVLEDLVALAGLGGDYGDDVNHDVSPF